MKPSDQPSASTRKKRPTLSAEEELAELLADPTLQPSISFLGLRNRPVSVPDTETVPDTDTVRRIILRERSVVSVPDTETVSDTETVPGPEKAKPQKAAPYHRPNAIAARHAQDGHSHSEHAVYMAL